MSDAYAYWHGKLNGEDPDPPENRTQMPCGFWRMRDNSPLAVWIDGEQRIALRGFGGSARPMNQDFMERVAEGGSFGVAVTEEAYRSAFDAGLWPDTDPVVAAQMKPPSPGHNKAPADDSPESFREMIEAAAARAGEYASIASDEVAAQAQSLRSRLTELAGKADKRRKAEKQPHFDAGKAVDATWNPIVEAGEEAANGIKTALEKWENEKLRKEREEQSRRDAERRAAEAEAAKTGTPPPAAPVAPEPAPVATTRIKGGFGRAASVKAVKVVTEVTDWPALYGYMKDHPEVTDLLKRLAQRAVDAGRDVPGVTIEERRKVA